MFENVLVSRIVYLIGTIIFTAFTLSIYAGYLQQFIAAQYSFYFELAMVFGQLIFQSVFIFRKTFAVKYLYAFHLITVSFLGSLLLWPAILLKQVAQLSPYFLLSYFLLVVIFMFFEHRRRLVKIKLPLYLSYTWLLYRSIISAELSANGYEVVIISRQEQYYNWENEQAIVAALEGAEMLISLAGRTVDCRYNEKNKREIMESRTKTTALLGEAILKCKQPPKLWINSSTATIYRHAEDKQMTEEDGEIGVGFSVSVAKAWEQMFFSFKLPNTRQVALRIAIVLGKNGGVVIPYLNLVQYGLGGYQGDGNQMFSWIHVEDLLKIILFIKEREHISGVLNCAAPNAVRNKELMRQFRTISKKKFGLPMPKWLLKLGAFMIGTETELVLKSRWVFPQRLLNEGYQFKFPLLANALDDVVPNTIN